MLVFDPKILILKIEYQECINNSKENLYEKIRYELLIEFWLIAGICSKCEVEKEYRSYEFVLEGNTQNKKKPFIHNVFKFLSGRWLLLQSI